MQRSKLIYLIGAYQLLNYYNITIKPIERTLTIIMCFAYFAPKSPTTPTPSTTIHPLAIIILFPHSEPLISIKPMSPYNQFINHKVCTLIVCQYSAYLPPSSSISPCIRKKFATLLPMNFGTLVCVRVCGCLEIHIPKSHVG